MANSRSSRIIPMLSYEDVARAIDWLALAFGFEEVERFADADGTVSHAVLRLEDSLLHVGFPGPDYQSPRHHAESCEHARKWSEVPYVIDGVLAEVEDVDPYFERASSAGAKILSPLEDSPLAGRRFRVEDHEGHRWMFAQLDAGS